MRVQWVLGREVPNRDVSNDYPRMRSTSQANGGGKGAPLTRNGEGEEIVYSCFEKSRNFNLLNDEN